MKKILFGFVLVLMVFTQTAQASQEPSINFVRPTQTGSPPAKVIDINGAFLLLYEGTTEIRPRIWIGNIRATIRGTIDLTNDRTVTPQLHQIVIDQPAGLLPGTHRLTLTTSIDTSSMIFTIPEEVRTPSRQIFTESGTWTKPEGVTRVKVTAVGSGGGGGNLRAGGAGGTGEKWIDVSNISSVDITVGAGGARNRDGETSSFGSHCSASGGISGHTTALGGVGQGCDINMSGGAGGANFQHANFDHGGTGGSSTHGGGGRGSIRGNSYGNPTPGQNFGGGGGSGRGYNHNPYFVGGPGIVIVEEFY